MASAADITVAWNDNSANEAGFKIERATSDLIFSQIAVVGANISVYTDSSVSPSTTYWYRVRATSASGDSAYSNTIAATGSTTTSTGTAPTISTISSATITSNSSTGPLVFTVSDAETAAGNLIVTPASSNASLIPVGNVIVAGTSSNRTVSVSPATGQTGTATVTLTVSDGTHSASTSFVVTVNASSSSSSDPRVFANATPIVIPNESSNANPYPSQINVTGMSGLIGIVTVQLKGFNQVWTNDMDVLLVSPTGQKLLLMSDVGTGETYNATFTFSDSATAMLPQSGVLYTGTYKPTNYDTDTDTFAAPAPAGPFESSFATFNGQNPNGTWTLYVRDAGPGNGRRFDGGWTLTLTTTGSSSAAPTISDIADQSIAASTSTSTLSFNVSDADTAATNLTITGSSSNPSLISNSSIVFGGSGTSRTVKVTPATAQTGSATITITVSDGTLTASDSFVVTVNALNTAPAISTIANQTLISGSSTSPLAFTVSDAESAAGNLIVTAASSNSILVPAANVVLGGSGSNRSASVSPATGKTGTATITLTVSDGALSANSTFVITVNAPSGTPSEPRMFVNSAAIAIPDESSNANPYPSQINVSGMSGLVSAVTVQLNGFSQSWTNDMDVLLVSPSGQKLLLMSDVGTGFTNNATFVFSDSASISLPQSGGLSSGTYKPTNYDTNTDTFAAPAPAGPYASSFATFNGQNPNGTWSLYVRDEGPGQGRRFDGGWTLSIATATGASAAPTISDIADQSIAVSTSTSALSFTINDADTPVSNLTVTGKSSNPALIPISSIVFGGSGSNRTVTVTPASAQIGTATVTIVVSDGTLTAEDSFSVETKAVSTKPAIATQPTSTQTIMAGESASFSVSATGVPTPSFQWRKNSTNISGATNAEFSIGAASTADAGVYRVVVSNSVGSVESNDAVLMIQALPKFTLQPAPQSVTLGTSAKFTVAVSAIPGATLQWYKNGTPISGATNAVLNISSTTPSDSGMYCAIAKNAVGTTTSNEAPLVYANSPVITKHPASQTVSVKTHVTFSAAAQGFPAPRFQWKKNGINISGATGTSLILKSVSRLDAGEYRVEAKNDAGYAISNVAQLVVNTKTSHALSSDDQNSNPTEEVIESGLVNLSVRANTGSASDALIVGFVIDGGATKPVLVRGVGPTLRDFGVTGALNDPVLSLYQGQLMADSNDDWSTNGNAVQIAGTSVRVGAFTLSDRTGDAALMATLHSGAYTVQLNGKGEASGVGLIEVYDAASDGGGKLVNLSVRAYIGGAEVPNVGFVVAGSTARKVMIRAVGPTLSAFGVTDSISDPQLELFRGSTLLDHNDNWDGNTTLSSTFGAIGAFDLADSSSRDAVILAWLEPGAYTVVVSGANGTRGVGLVEVYDVP